MYIARFCKIAVGQILFLIFIFQLLACEEPINEFSANNSNGKNYVAGDLAKSRLPQDLGGPDKIDASSTTDDDYHIVYNDSDGDGVEEILYVRTRLAKPPKNSEPRVYINDADGDGIPDEDGIPNESQVAEAENSYSVPVVDVEPQTKPEKIPDNDGDGFPDEVE